MHGEGSGPRDSNHDGELPCDCEYFVSVTEKANHFAVMPPELVRRCIMAGARSGNTVLDPFAGACTVGMVAIEQGREFLGVELSPEYAKIGHDRMDRARVKAGQVTKGDAKTGQQLGLFG